MSETPKKIWVTGPIIKRHYLAHQLADDTLYIRADLVDKLVEALKNTTAHLVAAHSLLQSGGQKAAASNTMFEIMLKDYEKSIEVGRAALKKLEDV